MRDQCTATRMSFALRTLPSIKNTNASIATALQRNRRSRFDVLRFRGFVEVEGITNRALSAALLLTIAGCSGNDGLLNPARIDASYGSRVSGASPPNVELYSGVLDAGTRAVILEGTFIPAWRAAVKQRSTLEGPAAAPVMQMRGIALSDRNCAAWFQSLPKLRPTWHSIATC